MLAAVTLFELTPSNHQKINQNTHQKRSDNDGVIIPVSRRRKCRHCAVVSELKLGNVSRQILFADFVERADRARLKIEQNPQLYSMRRAEDVLLAVVIDRSAPILIQAVIHAALIGREQADFVRDHFATNACALTLLRCVRTRAITLPLRCTAPRTAVLPEPPPPRP
jgi:hypothetical protein